MKLPHLSLSAKKWTLILFKLLMVAVSLLTLMTIQQILLGNRDKNNKPQYTPITWNWNGFASRWARIVIPPERNSGDHFHYPRKILNKNSKLLERDINHDDFIPEPKNNVNRSYVMNIGYPGQQGAAVRAMTSFQCFLSSLNKGLAVLEPYVENTKFKGHSSRADAVRFSDIFDFEHFNSVSRETGYAELVKTEEFVHHSPDYTILVLTKTKAKSTQRVLWSSQARGKEIRCLDESDINSFSITDKEIISESQNVLKDIKKTDVCVLRVIELSVSYHKKSNGLKNFPYYDIKEFIFNDWLPQQVTLVFNFWSGPYFVPVPTVKRKRTCKYSFNSDRMKNQFKPSKRLILDAERYEERYLGSQNKLAMMIRVERVLEYLREAESSSLLQCFQEISNISQKILLPDATPPTTIPLVTMDVGTYGSLTLNRSNYEDIISLSKEKLVGFYRHRNNWTFEEWEQSFIEASGGVVNSGYVGALQRILASRAECLVIMGGGNYQALAVQDYLDYHQQRNETCIHLVCTMAERNTLVQRTIERYSKQKMEVV